MILSNRDLFERIKKTIEELKRFNMDDDIYRIERALKISSLPGEMFGELRSALRDIDMSRFSNDLRYDIESEITYLDTILS